MLPDYSYNSVAAIERELALRFVTPALRHIVFPVLSRSGYLRRTAGAGPAVVTYHGVFPPGYQVQNPSLDGNLVTAESLRQQLQLLKSRYRVISPEDFRRWLDSEASLPPRSVLLTCDDALRNTLTGMVPILRELGLSCLFFATGASVEPSPSMLWYEELYLMLLDAAPPFTLSLPEVDMRITIADKSERHSSWWKLVESLSTLDRQLRQAVLGEIRSQLRLSETWSARFIADPALASRFMTLDLAGLRQLAAAGMTVGAHSLSHPILAKASPDFAWQEIVESRTALEDALRQTVWAFGYPFGNAATVTQREILMAEQAGFRCAFMNDGGGFGAKMNHFAVPRVHVTAEMNLSEFEAHVSGFYRSLRGRILGSPETAIGV
jgi:peptidoglycan/xylan/chitin deacetylase (PgdA/CDA1 family)